MKKLFLTSMLFILALSLVIVGGALAEVKVDIEKMEADIGPQAMPDLIVYDGYTSKDHNSFEPPPANDFTQSRDQLNCNVFIYIPGSAPSLLTASYTLILKRLDAPGFHKFGPHDFSVTNKAKWRLTLYWDPPLSDGLLGTWKMIPIVKSSTGSHIPINPNAFYEFTVHK